jgi:hypothetical protein
MASVFILDSKDYIAIFTVIVSVVAFLRPELTKLFKKFFGGVEIHLHPEIEIGFNAHGPNLGLIFSIRSKYSNILIKKIFIDVSKNNENFERRFEWLFSRKRDFLNNANSKINPVLPFVINDNVEKPVDLFFNDKLCVEKMREPLLEAGNDFYKFLKKKNVSINFESYESFTAILKSYDQDVDFKNSYDLHSFLNRQNYWEEGKYKAVISIETDRGMEKHKLKFSFEINKDMEENIRHNIITIQNNNFYYNDNNWFFVSSKIIE